jgi:hypothetical protein
MAERAESVRKMMRLLDQGVINEGEASSQTVDALMFDYFQVKQDTMEVAQSLPTPVLVKLCNNWSSCPARITIIGT